MSQNDRNDKDPRPVQRRDPERADERTAPTGDPSPTLDHVEQNEQVAQSSGGIEHRERVVTDEGGLAHRERITHDVDAERRQKVFKVNQIIWLVFGIIEVLIGMRVLLKLIAANPANGFADFIYNFAGVFLAPFFGLTGSPSSGGFVLEIPSLIAMLFYALLAWGIVYVVSLVFDQQATSSSSTYDRWRH